MPKHHWLSFKKTGDNGLLFPEETARAERTVVDAKQVHGRKVAFYQAFLIRSLLRKLNVSNKSMDLVPLHWAIKSFWLKVWSRCHVCRRLVHEWDEHWPVTVNCTSESSSNRSPSILHKDFLPRYPPSVTRFERGNKDTSLWDILNDSIVSLPEVIKSNW